MLARFSTQHLLGAGSCAPSSNVISRAGLMLSAMNCVVYSENTHSVNSYDTTRESCQILESDWSGGVNVLVLIRFHSNGRLARQTLYTDGYENTFDGRSLRCQRGKDGTLRTAGFAL